MYISHIKTGQPRKGLTRCSLHIGVKNTNQRLPGFLPTLDMAHPLTFLGLNYIPVDFLVHVYDLIFGYMGIVANSGKVCRICLTR